MPFTKPRQIIKVYCTLPILDLSLVAFRHNRMFIYADYFSTLLLSHKLAIYKVNAFKFLKKLYSKYTKGNHKFVINLTIKYFILQCFLNVNYVFFKLDIYLKYIRI